MPTIIIDNKTVKLRWYNRGSFSRIYLGDDNRVYAFIRNDGKYEVDYSKEAVSSFASGKHVPEITCHEDIYLKDWGWCNCYSMPKYYRLSGQARKTAKLLEAIRKEYDNKNWETLLRTSITYWEYSYNMLETAIKPAVDRLLYESILSILNAVASYDDTYMLEFPLWNLKQDKTGNLILLDIVFNVRAIKS